MDLGDVSNTREHCTARRAQLPRKHTHPARQGDARCPSWDLTWRRHTEYVTHYYCERTVVSFLSGNENFLTLKTCKWLFFICSFYVICIIFSCKSESCQKLTLWGFNIQFRDLSQSIGSLQGPRNFGCERVEDTEKWVRGGMMDGDEQGGKDTWLHLNSLLVFIFPLDTKTIVALSFFPATFTDKRKDVSVRCHRLFCWCSG